MRGRARGIGVGNPAVGRSVVMAPHGIVATSHPLAALAGIDILKQGGNAIDAAIATNAVMGVVEPMSCGLGGDLFAIVWTPKHASFTGSTPAGGLLTRQHRVLPLQGA